MIFCKKSPPKCCVNESIEAYWVAIQRFYVYVSVATVIHIDKVMI